MAFKIRAGMMNEIPQMVIRLCGCTEQVNSASMAEIYRITKCDKCKEKGDKEVEEFFKILFNTDIG